MYAEVCCFTSKHVCSFDLKVGGVETDMVALSQAVQSCGGIQQVVDKNKWPKVAEMLRIPSVVRGF